jgi:hypothetical protein
MSTIKTTTLSTQGGSTVPVDTVVNGTAKAWVNFNGTGTVAIRRAFNVSSITDNGTGDYTANFTTAMADANYAVVLGNSAGWGVTSQVAAANSGAAPTTQTTDAVRVSHKLTASNNNADLANQFVAIFS